MDSAEDIEMDVHSMHRRSHDIIACPNCGIYQTVEVEYDGGQGYSSLQVTPCSGCHQDLCSFCDQVKCECGQVVCLTCTVIVPDRRRPASGCANLALTMPIRFALQAANLS